jgi:hypothetical protein
MCDRIITKANIAIIRTIIVYFSVLITTFWFDVMPKFMPKGSISQRL